MLSMYIKQGRNRFGQFGHTGDIHSLYVANQRMELGNARSVPPPRRSKTGAIGYDKHYCPKCWNHFLSHIPKNLQYPITQSKKRQFLPKYKKEKK